MKNPTYLAMILLLFLVFCGVWASGPNAWGFNHFSYLPISYFLIWMVFVAVSVLPAVQNSLAMSLQKTIPYFIFKTKIGPFVLTLFLGLSFYFLQSQSVFLGDGYLILNLVEKGAPFRIFDNMDFFLHSLVFQISDNKVSAASLYRFGSILGGILAIPLVILLLKNLRWELWRRTLVLALFMFSGPVVLFFGYIESYTYLYIFITCFLISGVLYLENKIPLYVASSFFGLAIFFHLSAVFCLPALIHILFVDSRQRKWSRFPAAILPPLLLFGMSIFIHLQSGYSTQWFQHDFLENGNLDQMLIPFGGERGFFSLANLINQWNLLLIIAPVASLVVLLRIKSILARRRESSLQFLLVHLITIGMIGLVLDRKLGFARDWDLLVAHSASLYLVAAIVISAPKIFPGKALSLAITTSFFLTIPWVVLQNSEIFSLTRFTDVAKGFPTPARAHAFEELGQYFREKETFGKLCQCMINAFWQTLPTIGTMLWPEQPIPLLLVIQNPTARKETPSLSKPRPISRRLCAGIRQIFPQGKISENYCYWLENPNRQESILVRY